MWMAAYHVLRAAIRSAAERKQMNNKTCAHTPVNRYLLVRLLDQPKAEKQTNQGILLPDDFKPQQSEHAIVEIIKCAEDAKLNCDYNTRAIVERHMIKTIEHGDETIHMILENYVLCLVAR